MPIGKIVKPKNSFVQRNRIPKEDCYTILLPNSNHRDIVLHLEDAYKKIVTDNQFVKPIKVITSSHEEFKFDLPLELRAFIRGVAFQLG